MSEHHSDPPRPPRVEPEIIPPDAARYGQHDDDAIFMRYGRGYGTHRIYIARPGWPAIILGLLILGAFAATMLIVLLGFVLLLPILVGGIVLALIAGALSRRLRRF